MNQILDQSDTSPLMTVLNSEVLPFPDEKVFDPVRVPMSTRRIDLQLWSSGGVLQTTGISVCFNAFVAKIFVPYERTLRYQHASKGYEIMTWIIIANIIITPLLLLRRPFTFQNFPK